MSRRRAPKKRIVSPDPHYSNITVQILVNNLMKDGKKSLAYKIVYQSIEEIKGRSDQDPLQLIEKAVANVTPSAIVKARRIGGSTYQMPIAITPDRGKSLGIRWILNASRTRAGKSMISKLSNELLDAFNNQGNAIRKKQETLRMAEANKAFARGK
jgi:small subunit ribosomal protein S7